MIRHLLCYLAGWLKLVDALICIVSLGFIRTDLEWYLVRVIAKLDEASAQEKAKQILGIGE